MVDPPMVLSAHTFGFALFQLNSYTGCVDLSLEGSALSLSDPQVHPSAIQVTASVTEKGTGASASTSVQSQVHNQAFLLHFQCSQYFKPGLPYKGHVSKMYRIYTQQSAAKPTR